MRSLTRKQTEVLDFIREYIEDHSYSPTLEEIAQNFEVTTVTVFEHVRALEAKGKIRTVPNRSRSIELIVPGNWPTIPLLGRIAAGLPIEAVEDQESFDFTGLFPERSETFVLEVKGNSMIEDHIMDGDHVIIEQRQDARPGDTVAALIRGEETTLKRFYPEGDRIRLEPRNAAMKPIIVPSDEVQIQGVIMGVMRQY